VKDIEAVAGAGREMRGRDDVARSSLCCLSFRFLPFDERTLEPEPFCFRHCEVLYHTVQYSIPRLVV